MGDQEIKAHAPISDEQLERWRGYAEDAGEDVEYRSYNEKLDKRRTTARREMVETLQRFTEGEIPLEQLRSEFQDRTSHGWEVFGLKGVQGAMVLNQLVKRIPDEELDPRLKDVLQAPSDNEAARARLSGFYEFVEGWRKANNLNKLHIQTSNIPFFVSAWWHAQDPEAWPIIYPSGRSTLRREELYSTLGHPVEDYFAFRTSFRQMQQVLNVTPWELEHLLARLDAGGGTGESKYLGVRKQGRVSPPPTVVPVVPGVPPGENGKPSKAEEITHTQVQWMLAKIGQKLGLKVWIAENDRSRAHNGEKLSSFSIPQLPNVGMDPETQKTIRLIDVVWIKGQHQIAAAFEVEHTTSIFSGLLRMSDLVAVYPNISFPLYIVAPEPRMDLVRRQLRRPTFQGIGLHQRCGFFSDEALFLEYPHIMKWAASPDAIEKQLAQRVGDVQEGEPADWLQD
jgi:hypothetical protein